jgi:hypothetical protein
MESIKQKHVDPVWGECTLIFAPEAAQDMAMYQMMSDMPRSGEIREQEVKDWRTINSLISELYWTTDFKYGSIDGELDPFGYYE